jgi:hypothetical protein
MHDGWNTCMCVCARTFSALLPVDLLLHSLHVGLGLIAQPLKLSLGLAFLDNVLVKLCTCVCFV